MRLNAILTTLTLALLTLAGDAFVCRGGLPQPTIMVADGTGPPVPPIIIWNA